MDLVRQILLFVHILGFSALLGGLFVQVRAPERRVNGAMRDGVGTAVLAGVGLVGVLEAGDGDVDQVKVGVKLLIGVAVLALVMANLRKDRLPGGVFFTILALALVNVGVAIFWSPIHAA